MRTRSRVSLRAHVVGAPAASGGELQMAEIPARRPKCGFSPATRGHSEHCNRRHPRTAAAFFRLALASAAGKWKSESRDTSHDYCVASPWKAACVCVCGIVWGLLAVPRLDPGSVCGLWPPPPPGLPSAARASPCTSGGGDPWPGSRGGSSGPGHTSVVPRMSRHTEVGEDSFIGCAHSASWSCRVMCLQPGPGKEACAVSRFFQHL